MSAGSVNALRKGVAKRVGGGQSSVIQVTWSLAAGGSERYAVDVAAGVDRARFIPYICALDQGGAFETEAKMLGIPYTLMRRPAGLSPRLVWRLYQVFRLNRATIVHTHHFPSLFYSFLPAILMGARLIHTEHGLATYTARHRRLALRFMSCFCHAVVAVGSESERFLRNQVGIATKKLSVIPGGVRIDRFRSVSRAESRRALGLKESDRVVVMVARLSPEKNHALLLNAFDVVLKHIHNAHLLIVGGGPEQAAIADRIRQLGLSDSVSMLGVRHDIPEILSAADIFALTSDREALPISILEAMAAGLPVVSTNVGDVHTIIEDGANGRLVQPGDFEAFANAVINLLQEPELATLMGNTNRVSANEFSVSTMAEKYEQLYVG